MSKNPRKHGPIRKKRFGSRSDVAASSGDGKTNVHVAPPGTDIVRIVEELLKRGIGDPLVIIEGKYNQGILALRPEDRVRLERVEPEIKGKRVIMMTEDQAAGYGLL